MHINTKYESINNMIPLLEPERIILTESNIKTRQYIAFIITVLLLRYKNIIEAIPKNEGIVAKFQSMYNMSSELKPGDLFTKEKALNEKIFNKSNKIIIDTNEANIIVTFAKFDKKQMKSLLVKIVSDNIKYIEIKIIALVASLNIDKYILLDLRKPNIKKANNNKSRY